MKDPLSLEHKIHEMFEITSIRSISCKILILKIFKKRILPCRRLKLTRDQESQQMSMRTASNTADQKQFPFSSAQRRTRSAAHFFLITGHFGIHLLVFPLCRSLESRRGDLQRNLSSSDWTNFPLNCLAIAVSYQPSTQRALLKYEAFSFSSHTDFLFIPNSKGVEIAHLGFKRH